MAPSICQSDPRFVGDPIDVVTGAATDTPIDLLQRGPVPLRWVRYYSSARSHIHGSLGWGHSHDFDRMLCRDLDGIRYQGPLGEVVGFQELAVGGSEAAGGMLLRRISHHDFTVVQAGNTDHEYHFAQDSEVGRLVRMRLGPDTIEFGYGVGGVLIAITDSRGRRIRVSYDAAGRVVALNLVELDADRLGKLLLAYEYDDAGNLERAVDLYHTSLGFAYDAAHRMTRRTDRRGYSFHFEYDALGRCVHSRGDDGLFEVFLDYHPEAKTTFVRRGDGGRWTYHYNDDQAITQIIDPHGSSTTYILDELGRPVQEVDPNGNITQLHYNALGQYDYRIDPNGYVLPTKEANPNPPDPLGYELPTTPLEWDFGHVLDVERIQMPTADDPVLAQFPAAVFNTVLGETATYDLTAQRDAAESVDREQFSDDYGRALEQSVTRHNERWRYDDNGNLIEHRDPDGALYKSIYQSWNALSRTIDPLGNVHSFQQNVQGLVSKVTDPGGTVTEYTYDLKEKLVEIRENGRRLESYRRDAAGNIVEKLDAADRTLVHWEIGPGNLDKVRLLASGEKHVFAHDERGRVIEAQTPAGAATFQYDEAGRLVADKRDGKGVAHEFEMDQIIGTTYLDCFKVRYHTLDNGDLVVQDPTGAGHTFQIGSSGLILKLLANGSRELCEFDGTGRCRRKALVRKSASAALWMRGYTYSPAGDLLTMVDTSRGTVNYRHDAAHRLIEETLSEGGERRFMQDVAGNLIEQPGLANAVMDPGNRLKEANGEFFTYNVRGNLQERRGPTGETRYEYNDLDMLVRCDLQGRSWTASYDGYCRRVQKSWQGQTTTYYWDDFRLAAEVRHDGSCRLYIYADHVALAPFLFIEYASVDAKPESGERFYILTNQVGAPLQVESEDSSVVWSARLDPYGRADVDPKSTIEMPLRFPGHYHDAETGLHYNRFRYYSPELGRYLQSDPAGQVGGINVYAYPVDPLVDVDIDGLKKQTRGASQPGRRTGTKGRGGPGGANAQCDRTKGTQGEALVDKMIKEGKIKIEGDKKFRGAVRKDLITVANTQTGQQNLNTIRDSPHSVTIKQNPPPPPATCSHETSRKETPPGSGRTETTSGAYPPGTRVTDANNPNRSNNDPNNTTVGTGTGASSTIGHDPKLSTSSHKPDAILNHELGHAANNASGTNDRNSHVADPDANDRRRAPFPNREEEKNTLGNDNAYREERRAQGHEGYPPRDDYS